MRTHADPAPSISTRSPTPAAALPQFADSRAQAVAQARLDALAQGGPRLARLRALQGKADAGLARAGGLAVLQRQSASDEDEAQQAKFPATQRATQEASPPAGPAPETATQSTREAAAKPNSTGLPDGLKSGVESLSGMSLDHVRVHYASPQPARLNAHAYTQGGDIHVAPGQERHLPHEAWHVVQQAQGRVRPTRQMKGGVPINDDRGLEREADAMGARAAQRAPAQAAARAPNGAAAGPQGACVQRWSLSSAWDSVKSVGRGIADVAGSVVDAAAKGIGWLKDKALGWIAEHAESIPGFHLLAVAVGRNPVTGHAVERSAMNVTRGVMGLIPGGDKLFKQLQESGALERAFAWFSEQIETLNLGWDAIRGLFGQAWDALSIADVTSPSRAFEKIKAVFAAPLTRIKNFALAVGKKVLEFVVEGALRLAGPAGQQVMDIFRRGKETLMLIVSDPVGFARNLIQAVVQGMKQFGANIWTHLKKGLTGWLFGTLASAGLTLPEKFDLKGILSLVLQILGLTYSHLRKKLVKLMGEKNVKRVEQAVEFVTLLVTEGIGAAWQKIVEYIGNLKDTVLGAIKDWVVTKIVTAALTKIATMFNPVGAVIQAVIAAYNTVMFFIERAKQIMALVDSVIDSISQIAQGKIGAAAKYVEETMARTIPVILSFLARLLGLSGLDEKIRKIIETIQGKVEAALDKVVEFIREKAKAVFGKEEGGGKTKTAEDDKKQQESMAIEAVLAQPPSKGERSATLKHDELDQAVRLTNRIVKQSKTTADVERYFQDLAGRYRLKTIRFVGLGSTNAKIEIQVNPTYEICNIGGLEWFRMLGSGACEKNRTNVLFKPRSMTLGSVSATVGSEMIANPLSQDHQAGSDSSADSAQTELMNKLAGHGNTSLPNPSKYIKGHLLNHDVGGPGNAINLYPITAEANDRHLKFVEKWVKASIQAGFISYYRVWITNEQKREISNGGDYIVDSHLNFEFSRLNTAGKPISMHQGYIDSVYKEKKDMRSPWAPYDIESEFCKEGKPEADTLDMAKTTPNACPIGGEMKSALVGYKLMHTKKVKESKIKFEKNNQSSIVPLPTIISSTHATGQGPVAASTNPFGERDRRSRPMIDESPLRKIQKTDTDNITPLLSITD